MRLIYFKKGAGKLFIGISWGHKNYNSAGIHFIVRPSHRILGYSQLEYDGIHHLFGFGRLALFVWSTI